MQRRTRIKFFSATGLLAGLGLGVALVPAWSASAADPLCGSEVTTNVTLTGNVSCSGDGLTITRNNVVIDLKNFTLAGTGDTGTTGIRVVPGVTGVVVQRGTITGFGTGVVVDSATHCQVSKLRITTRIQGVLLANAATTTVDKNVISGAAENGIKVDGPANTIVQNTVSNNAFGIAVSNGSQGNLVAQNTLADNRDFAIATFDGATATVVSRNAVTGGATGIVVTGGSTGTRVSQNAVQHASSYGVLVEASTAQTSVSQNTSAANGSDGIRVEAVSATVTKNTAFDNAGAGIVSSGTDGGGNVAYGNGAPCLGVVCSSS